MWIQLRNKVINWITNLAGTVGGVPQIIAGVLAFQAGDVGTGVTKICEGVSIIVIGYFTGKSALNLEAGK